MFNLQKMLVVLGMTVLVSGGLYADKPWNLDKTKPISAYFDTVILENHGSVDYSMRRIGGFKFNDELPPPMGSGVSSTKLKNHSSRAISIPLHYAGAYEISLNRYGHADDIKIRKYYLEYWSKGSTFLNLLHCPKGGKWMCWAALDDDGIAGKMSSKKMVLTTTILHPTKNTEGTITKRGTIIIGIYEING